jgi:chitin synthase
VALSSNTKKNSKVLTGAVKMQSILQSFGHAQISNSANSSRYALYTEYQFSRSGRMVGIKTLDYLLEKSRVTSLQSLPDGERNFNIFYQLIGGIL